MTITTLTCALESSAILDRKLVRKFPEVQTRIISKFLHHGQFEPKGLNATKCGFDLFKPAKKITSATNHRSVYFLHSFQLSLNWELTLPIFTNRYSPVMSILKEASV
jgi:hypothetical protein